MINSLLYYYSHLKFSFFLLLWLSRFAFVFMLSLIFPLSFQTKHGIHFLSSFQTKHSIYLLKIWL